MTELILRKGQTGEPTNNTAQFGTHQRTADDINLGLSVTERLTIDRDAPYAVSMPNLDTGTPSSFWDDPEFQKGHLEDIRTEIADRVYEGRNDPDTMQKLYAARDRMVLKLRAAGHNTQPAK